MHPEERRIYFALLTAGFIVILLVVVFISSILRYQRRKVSAYRLTLQQEMEIQETERTRIASDLHDDISSALSAIQLRLSTLRLPDREERQIVNDTLFYINRLSDKVRRVSNHLLPVVLERQGLKAALEELIAPLSLSTQYTVTCHLAFDDVRLLPEASIHIYRMFQEMISNIIKHSHASQVLISVSEEQDALSIHVKDNGAGYNPSKTAGNGLGLYNIRTRADILRGRFYLTTSEGAGVDYAIEIPTHTIIKKE